MPTILMLDDRQVGGDPHSAGDVVVVSDTDARLVIPAGFARLATDGDTAGATNPQPAEKVRIDLGIATAVPGGKRPNRR